MSEWVLVPREPTPEMLPDAWRAAVGKCDHNTLRAIYRAMIAAAPQAEPVAQWLPIESAPRDGSWFVVARFVAGEDAECEVGRYSPLMFTTYVPAGDDESDNYGLYRKVQDLAYEWEGFNNFPRMTHWMPLPNGPLPAPPQPGESKR